MNNLKYKYYTYHHIFNTLIHILILFILSQFFIKNMLYCQIPIWSASNSLHSFYKTLPSINIINNYFNYNTVFIAKYHEIFLMIMKTKLVTNIIEKPQYFHFPFINEIKLLNDDVSNKPFIPTKITKDDYIPSRDLASYEVSEIVPISQPVEIVIDTKSLSDEILNVKHNKPTTTFSVVIPDPIEKTIVDKPPIIRKDLPFEIPIEILVKKDPEPINTALVSAKTSSAFGQDMLNSVFMPSYEGKSLYSSTTIFNLHLDIISIARTQLELVLGDHINPIDAQRVIRDIVHSYIEKHNALVNITMGELRNSNHLINLLIRELIVNSMFAYDEEKFMLHNIAGALIIESLCAIEKTEPSSYYDNPSLYENIIRPIIARFLN